MTCNLNELVRIRAGHPFRGKIPELKNGNGFAIQIRDIDDQYEIDWNRLIQTNVGGSKEPNWLQEADIIFTSRGKRNVAAFIKDVPMNIVAAQHMFVLTVKNPNLISPEFLAWQINQKKAQTYLKINAEGSLQLSIKRSILEKLQITIPNIEKQYALIELNNKVKQEKRVLNTLIENRTQQMQGIAKDLLG